MFQHAAVRVFRLAAVSACLVHGATAMASGGRSAGAVDSSRATVFLRVIGDIEVVADRETTPIARTRLQRTNVQIATGSGFLFSSTGQILTCHHVISDGERTGLVEGKKAKVLVRVRRIEAMLPAIGGPDGLPASGPYEATVVASNSDLDIAVLSISGASFPTLDLGDSDALEPGDGLETVGYPFGQDVEIGRPTTVTTAPGASVSHGDFSAYRIDIQGQRRFLQTSAAVNPGNSGGPVVDLDGYVVGIVSRRLASVGSGTGIGFAVPINLVKEFLEANGLDGQLPARRVALGPLQAPESKGLRVRLPWGVSDSSPLRTHVDTGSSPLASPTLHVDRLVSPWGAVRLADALVTGQTLEPLAPEGASSQRARPIGGRRAVVGRVSGTWPDGTNVRMEYAVIELGEEKILARYVGSPNLMAYNASVFRASLASIEGEALRRHAPTVPRPAAWVPAIGLDPSSLLAEVRIPAGWRQEPDGPLLCEGLPPASDAVTASPLADFTRSVRAAVVRQSGLTAARAAIACGTPLDEEPDRYQKTIASFGTRLFVEGKFVQVAGDAVLHYQVIGPAEESAALRDLFALWLSRLAGSARHHDEGSALTTKGRH